MDKTNADAILKLAGRLATSSRLVTTANAKNLSDRIEAMEVALNEYDQAVFQANKKPIKP